MSQSGIYSENKLLWWYAREQKLPDAPKQVQLILSDLCNQDCHFCLTAGTLIDTLHGTRPVSALHPGDEVYGPTGTLNEITQTSARLAEEIVEIGCGSLILRSTPEHPVLTNRGWVPAGEIQVGDRAVVRVRMRGSREASPWHVEQVHQPPPAGVEATGIGEATRVTAHEAMQSHEGQDNVFACIVEAAREACESYRAGQEEHRSRSAETYAVRQEPDERSSHVPESNGKDPVAYTIEERNPLLLVGQVAGDGTADSPYRGRDVLDRSSQSGRAGDRSEESLRSHTEGMLHQWTKDTDSRIVCAAFDPALPEQGLAVSGDLQAGSPLPDPGQLGESDPGLRIEPIQLERGLALRSIDSIRRVKGRVTVYNFSCKPEEAYEAGGFVVHNCAYRMSGYTSNELFVGSSKKAAKGHSNPLRWIEKERALKLLDEIKELGCLSVQFTGGGEPTVHPHHEQIFDHALELGLRCSLVSNGIKWSDTMISSILPFFDWVRVSIDSATPESYARIRRTKESQYHTAWEHVAALSDWIHKTGTAAALGVGFVVTPQSWSEILEFAHLAKLHGAHNVRFTAMFSTEDEHPFSEIYDGIRVSIDLAKALQNDDFKVYDNFGSRFDDLKQHAPDYSFCSYQHYTAYIGGDLQAYRCCVLAYNKRGQMEGGDLTTRSFADFWRSQERKDDQNALDPRGCERCQFNQKNRALLYVMGNTESDATPRHMEWP